MFTTDAYKYTRVVHRQAINPMPHIEIVPERQKRSDVKASTYRLLKNYYSAEGTVNAGIFDSFYYYLHRRMLARMKAYLP